MIELRSPIQMIIRLLSLCLALLFSAACLRAQEPVWLIPPTDSLSSISRFSEGLAHVSVWGSQRLYYADSSGHLVTFKGPFEAAGNFHDGLAWVSIEDSSGNTRFGYIDKTGRQIIPCIYEKVQDFSCNRAAVQLSGVWQYIDQAGVTVILDSDVMTKVPAINGQQEMQWVDVDPPAFHCGRLLYCDKNGRYGYRDTTGRYIIRARFDAAQDFTDGVALVADTLPGPVMEGDDTLSRLYSSLPPGPPRYQSRVIDRDGKCLFQLDRDFSLDMNRRFSNHLCAFLMDSQDSSGWGVINTRGQIIIPPKYRNEPMPNYDGVSFVQVDGNESTGNKDGYLITFDTLGKKIAKIPFVTPYGDLYDSNLGFHEGLMAVRLGDQWGYMDAKGTVLIRPQFAVAMNFHEGFAVVKTQDGKVGIIRRPYDRPVMHPTVQNKRSSGNRP